MTRILFVDDEPYVLEGLRDVLRRDRRRWQMTFVGDGAAAVGVLARERFDIVVCDMRMPVVDGSVVLEEARRLQPEACRVVLSGQTDRESMLRSIRFAHRFLAKPCDPDELRDTLESLISLLELVPDGYARRAAGAITALRTLPDVRQEALAAALDPDCAPQRVAVIAARDPALTANLLRLGNSGFFGSGRPATTVAAAAAAIGADGLRAPELASALFYREESPDGWYPIDLDVFAAHALTVAAQVTAALPEEEAAFAAGCLHDVGKLVLAEATPDLFSEIVAEAEARSCPIEVVERERCGATHAEVGALLLGLWGLPPAIVDAVAGAAGPGGALAEAIAAAEAHA